MFSTPGLPGRALVLASLLTVPVSAQTVEPVVLPPPPDSAEALPELTTADLLGEAEATEAPAAGLAAYTSFRLSAGWSSSAGALTHTSGALGAELPSGLRLGGRLSATTYGSARTVAVGPEVSYQRDLGRGYQLNTRGAGAVAVTSGTIRALNASYTSRQIGVGGSVAVEREVPLVGTLRIAPSAGVYGVLARRSGLPQFDLDARTEGSAGLLLGADLRFRAFGRDISIPLSLPVPLVGRSHPFDTAGLPYGGSGLRLDL